VSSGESNGNRRGRKIAGKKRKSSATYQNLTSTRVTKLSHYFVKTVSISSIEIRGDQPPTGTSNVSEVASTKREGKRSPGEFKQQKIPRSSGFFEEAEAFCLDRMGKKHETGIRLWAATSSEEKENHQKIFRQNMGHKKVSRKKIRERPKQQDKGAGEARN